MFGFWAASTWRECVKMSVENEKWDYACVFVRSCPRIGTVQVCSGTSLFLNHPWIYMNQLLATSRLFASIDHLTSAHSHAHLLVHPHTPTKLTVNIWRTCAFRMVCNSWKYLKLKSLQSLCKSSMGKKNKVISHSRLQRLLLVLIDRKVQTGCLYLYLLMH